VDVWTELTAGVGETMLLDVGCEAKAGGGQAGTGVGALEASLDEDGGVSVVAVYLAVLTGVEGTCLYSR
jgi:hypothetical protein